MSIAIDAAVCSNMGRVRKNNEDNFYFNGLYMDESQRNAGGLFNLGSAEPIQIYAVCDGMGGEEGGEDASITAVRSLMEYAKSEHRVNGTQQIKDLLQKISDTIEENAQKKGFHSGTTIAMVAIVDDTIRMIHVGDSRVYCLESGKLTRKTVDHSEVQRMYSMGLITEEEMDTHPKRHVISQFLGMSRSDGLVAPSISEREQLRKGQKYLLCSDGLTDMVKDPEIKEILSKAETAEEAVKQLTIAALRNGGKDNVTSICLYVGNEKGSNKGISLKGLKRNRLLAACGLAVSGVLIISSLIMLFS